MAMMHPESLDSVKRLIPSAKKRVFEKLKGLDPNIHVVWNVSWTERGRDCEIDFVIIDPRRRAILTLEVKSGGISLEDEQGYSTDRDGFRYPIDPVEQATNASYAIRDMIQRDKGESFDFCWGWGVVLPSTTRPDNMLPMKGLAMLPKEHIIAEEDLKDPIAAIDRLFDNLPRAELTNADQTFVQDILGIIRPKYQFARSISSYIEDNERQWIMLKRFQLSCLATIKRYNRYRIVGGAGTGKTVIATEAAAQEAKEGRKVLYLCFNKLLADYIYGTTRELPDNERYEVYTYGKLCERILWTTKRRSNDNVLEALEQHREALNEQDRVERGFYWDVVIVDEGQDFARDSWDVIEKFVKEGEDNKLWVFYDPYQEIRTVRERVDSMISTVEEFIPLPPFVLVHNFRNTKAIGEATNDLIKEEDSTVGKPDLGFAPDGAPIEYLMPTSPQATGTLVKNQIDTWIEGDIPRGRIAVLTTADSCKNSYKQISDTCKRDLKDIRKSSGSGEIDRNRPTLVSVERFKGLEADAVVLVVPTNYEEEGWRTYYVGVSRARQFLTVVKAPLDSTHFKRLSLYY